MYTRVALVLDEKECLHGYMQLALNGVDLSITYFDEHGGIIVTEKISQFQSITISKDNTLNVTFKSKFTDRSIIFNNRSDMNAFFEFLRNNIILNPAENNPLNFEIQLKSKSGGGILGKVTEALKKTGDSFNFNMNQVKPVIIRPVDAYTYGNIVPVIPSTKFEDLTLEKVKTLDLSTVSYSKFNVIDEALPTLFDRLLLTKPEETKTKEYLQIREQWQLTTKEEWNRFVVMRQFTHDLESWITSEKFSNLHKQLIFNIAMSLFTFLFGDLKFDETLQFELSIIVAIYLDDQLLDDSLITRDSREVTLEEAEILTFWPLLTLYRKIKEGTLSVQQESLKVFTMLENISKSTAEILTDRNYKTLDFALSDSRIFFTRWRDYKINSLILASALSCGNLPVMRQSMLCAALVLLHEELQEIPLEMPQVFSEEFSLRLRRLDGRLILYNAEKMMSIATHFSFK